MPPDSRHTNRPLLPVGKPPAPGSLSKKKNEWSGNISMLISSAG
jgi:hypothetical protein